MTLSAQIEAVLMAHPRVPMSIAELHASIPESSFADVEEVCRGLREQGRLGRNGADTGASPYRFYLKRY